MYYMSFCYRSWGNWRSGFIIIYIVKFFLAIFDEYRHFILYLIIKYLRASLPTSPPIVILLEPQNHIFYDISTFHYMRPCKHC